MSNTTDVLTSIGKHTGSATKAIGKTMEDYPLPSGAILGASATGLAAYKLHKYLKRKRDEKMLSTPDEISAEDKKWKEGADV
jgi:hypothetical protein